MTDGDKIERGLSAVAEAIDGLTHAVHRLGNADAMTPMGGLEALGKAVEDAAGTIAVALDRE